MLCRRRFCYISYKGIRKLMKDGICHFFFNDLRSYVECAKGIMTKGSIRSHNLWKSLILIFCEPLPNPTLYVLQYPISFIDEFSS